jgi:hypothetical protein
MDGWERLFRKFLPSQPKPPIRASVEDYSFIFSLFDGTVGIDGEFGVIAPLTSFILKGDEAVTFLRTGKSGWLKLDKPVKLPEKFACKDELLRAIEIEENDPVVGMESTMHSIRQSDGTSCELNRSQFGDRYDGDDSDHDKGWKASSSTGTHTKDDFGNTYYGTIDTLVRELGKLTDILDTTSTELSEYEYMINAADVIFDRDLRTTILEGDDGTVQQAITHVNFTATISIAEELVPVSDCIEKGATLADFLEQLNVEWK